MKKIVIALLIAVAHLMASAGTPVTDSTWHSAVRTVILSRSGSDLEPPVLTLGQGGQLRLQFDMLEEQPRNLRYTISHCDAQWVPDDLEPYDFISGFESGPVENYEFSFTTIVPYVHYSQTFPDAYTQFTHSGNYLLSVTLDGEPDSILLTRRFYVTEEVAKLEAVITRPYDGHDIDRRQQVDAVLSSRDLRLEHQYLTLVAAQNGRIDNRRTLQFSGYDGDRLCYRNRPANIFDGGNTFRFFDMSNLRAAIYNIRSVERYGGETFVLLRPEEDRSRKHFITETTLNGGMKVNIWDRNNPALEADYAWVSFSLPMKQPFLDGSVHIVGDLTQWQLDSSSRMDYNPQFHAYTKRLLLKQGYYAYQLVFLPTRAGSEGETWRIEGDHRETPNTYTLYLYQRTPADRADRLLAVKVVPAP